MSEYAKAGVDYSKVEPFKAAMIRTARRTVTFPNKRGVFVHTGLLHAHGGVYSYEGPHHRHLWCKTQEGLGNENWISDLMRLRDPNGPTRHDTIGYDLAMMWVNDCLAQGGMPVICTDEVIASDSDWFKDEARAEDFARGLYEACEDSGMALVQGESAPYKYLVNPRPPVKSSAIFGGCVTGIIAPADRLITGEMLRAGDRIIGVTSSGIHANGISLVIRRVMGDPEAGLKGLPDEFDTKLPSGMTIGDAVHIRVRCYVQLVERLIEKGIPIHAILPGTGGGVGKLAFDKRPFSYLVHSWPEVPELFLKMRELGVPLVDCLETFNWGIGLYLFVAKEDVEPTLREAVAIGSEAMEVGEVREGERCTIFGPEKDLRLPPPGE